MEFGHIIVYVLVLFPSPLVLSIFLSFCELAGGISFFIFTCLHSLKSAFSWALNYVSFSLTFVLNYDRVIFWIILYSLWKKIDTKQNQSKSSSEKIFLCPQTIISFPVPLHTLFSPLIPPLPLSCQLTFSN